MSTGKQFKSYDIILQPLDPMRVGGKDDLFSESDNSIAAIGGQLCVPGATLKGALRAEMERWLFTTFYQNGQWKDPDLAPCIPSTRTSHEEKRLVNQSRYRQEYCRNGKPICPACYMLGCMGLVGFVSIPFLFGPPVREKETLYSSRIDRATRTVAQSANRPYDLAAGVEFSGVMDVLVEDAFLGWKLGSPRQMREGNTQDLWLENNEKESQKILKDFLLDRLPSIREIGGYRSKGCGRVKITVTESEETA